MLDLIEPGDADLDRDLERLEAVRQGREHEAAAYFARNAARWEEVRSLYVDEAEVEAAIQKALGAGRVRRLIDLGTGAGRMLSLLGPRADSAIGLDLSQQMLNIARRNVLAAGCAGCELRHGDIFATGLGAGLRRPRGDPPGAALPERPAAALAEAARFGGAGRPAADRRFRPHDLEYLRQAHQHRRLGFADEEIGRWLEDSGLAPSPPSPCRRLSSEGLTVKIWSARKAAEASPQRSAA